MRKRKLFVVSDIHGHCALLKEALEKAGFDKDNGNHLLVCCGDCFDRGNENLQVLKYMESLKHKVIIRGNHEDMLLEIMENSRLKEHNFLNGTVRTIEDFFGKYVLDYGSFELDFAGKTRMLDRVTEFIERMVDFYETEHYVFVHGWLPVKDTADGCQIDPNWRHADEMAWMKARWNRWDDMYTRCNRLEDKTIVCGHVPTFLVVAPDKKVTDRKAEIFYGEGVIAIDAGTFSTGEINVLVVEE